MPDLNLKQQFQVVKSVPLHFILEIATKTKLAIREPGSEGGRLRITVQGVMY